MRIRVCHPFGNPNSYNAALSLLETDQLKRFHTSLYQPFGWRKRAHPELPRAHVTTHPFRELVRLGATTLPMGALNGRSQGFIDWVTRGFDMSTAISVMNDDFAVYCYEDSAQQTFKRASQVGAARIYELPILHYREMRRIFEVESSREPQVAQFLQTLRAPDWKLEQKDREILTADIIVVPAGFVKNSIERFLKPPGQIIVVPYGVDVTVPVKEWSSQDQQGPLRLFFAGILGPRKGVHTLFAALSKLPGHCYRLSLAGRWEPGFREWLTEKYSIDYAWLGQLAHTEVYDACRRSQLFVFPSLAEGFGLVLLEAMSSGVPVLTTDQTAGPEIVEDGADGWVVPAGDELALLSALSTAMDVREQLPDMGAMARRKALKMNWAAYRANLRSRLFEALDKSPSPKVV